MYLARKAACLSYLLLCAAGLSGAEPAGEVKTYLAERGQLIFTESFAQAPDKLWTIQAPGWETVDGALKATHRMPFREFHGPVMQCPIALTGAIVQLSFKLEGKAQVVVHFNKKNGHLCRVVARHDGLYVIRRDSGGDKGIRLDESAKVIAPDVWHTLVLEVQGSEMLASLDGKEIIFGGRDDLDQPKTSLILESAGGTAWFKDLSLWEGLPNTSWTAHKAKLLDARKTPKDS